MSDLMARCDWYDSTLSVVLPEDPERIAVRLFDSRLAPARLYVPEVETLTLRDENAKLRELVRDMRTCIDHACMCEFCPLFVTEEDMDERRCIADIKAHMRELGVDDGTE